MQQTNFYAWKTLDLKIYLQITNPVNHLSEFSNEEPVPPTLIDTAQYILYAMISSFWLISGGGTSLFLSVITSHTAHHTADWKLHASLNEFEEQTKREAEPQQSFLFLVPDVSPSQCVTGWGSAMTGWLKMHAHLHLRKSCIKHQSFMGNVTHLV